MKPEIFTNATTREQKAQVWQSFFERAIREKIKPVDWLSRGSQDSENGGAPYWGKYVLDSLKVDDGSIAKSVVWQIDDRIHIRSENGAGTAKIAKHSIHYSPALDGAILLAVAEPEGTFEVMDTHLLVVAKEPFSCRIPCSNDRIVPDQKTSGQIQDVLATGLKKSAKEIVTKFAALRGSFTKHYAVQYVA